MPEKWFITDNTVLQSSIDYQYDYWLITLSIAIAILAAYSGFDTFDRFNAARRQVTRFAWLATGALTLGGGIWSMHFIAMMAVQMDMAVQYEVKLTILSAVMAIIGCGIAMAVVGGGEKTTARIITGGSILGAAIGVMHYMGMSAMRMAADIVYDPYIFAVSVIVAVALSSLSLRLLVFGLATQSLAVKSSGAIVMGGSIASVHYTGMAATYMVPGASEFSTASLTIDNHTMAFVISGCVFAAMQMTMIGSIISRQFEQKDRELTRQGIYLEKILENAVDGFTLIKPDGEIIAVNPIIESYFGYSASELVGLNITELLSDTPASELKHFNRLQELTARNKDGTDFPVDLSISSIDLPDGHRFMGIVRDISKRKSAEEEREKLITELRYSQALMAEQAKQASILAEELNFQKLKVEESKKQSDHLARHDPLTKLPNRRFFFETLETAMDSMPYPGTNIAVLFIDLDNFKKVNDELGHEHGDKHLVTVADNICSCVGESDMVARLGGDEFGVITSIRIAHGNKDAETLADRICSSLRISVETAGAPIVTGASIGIAIYSHDGDNIEALMKTADAAMYQAKEAGRNQFRFRERQTV